MRGLDMALTAFALRAMPPRPSKPDRRLLPFIDDADAALLNRAALPQQFAALVASLWPAARQCVVRPRYEALPAPALLSAVHRFSWQALGPPAPALLLRAA